MHAAVLANLPTLSGYYAGFATGLVKDINQTRSSSLHRDNLPPEPRNLKELRKYPLTTGFQMAMEKEYNNLKCRGTFKTVPKAEASNEQILPLKWVFKYKFNSNGYLQKHKARLCVCGDLQITEEETYAATLAARIFCALMAIAAAFDLEIRQYDAVNAFTNAKLNKPVYCYCPEGFDQDGHVLKLLMALYGLKISPLLWYKELTSTLTEFGLKPVPGTNCLYTDGRLIVFFYVDDIAVLFAKKRPPKTGRI